MIRLSAPSVGEGMSHGELHCWWDYKTVQLFQTAVKTLKAILLFGQGNFAL